MDVRSFLLLAVLTASLCTCTTNSVTGRRQFLLVPDAELLSLSNQQYNSFLAKNKVIKNSVDAVKVETIGRKIAAAITRYFELQGNKALLKDYEWDFKLVNDKSVNAWCMPGGKVVVYTGLLPITQNDNALAVVMGHEIAHAISKHGNERMSQGLAQQAGGEALSAVLLNKPALTRDLFLSAYGAGSAIGVLLPFSRKQELEADKFGLIFAALAGYDPQAAVEFWERMAKASGNAGIPEWLSTHPSNETRVAKVKTYVLEAKKYVSGR